MDYRQVLQQYWGYPDFRGIQREIIESIGSGHDTLGLMPTGGGKSITFQVPAMTMEGTCVVITPLIALMKDQVQHLRDRGITAAAIHSGMSRRDIVQTLENAIFGGCKFLYVSPERLSSELFLTKFRHMKVCFITVDEAHCISQWGYDFRPSYLHIADIRALKPDVPVLALTATATPQVAEDIQQQLHFREPCLFRMSFERKNLTYVVRPTNDKKEETRHILQAVDGCAIVYTRNREKTGEIAEALNSVGISATSFHAGLDTATKDERQKAWQEDKIRVMVATNAFGMGIDKPDVRMVIHADVPDSMEEYFQEAGRAGRDGNHSYAVLLFDQHSDITTLERRIDNTFPSRDYIRDIYEHLAYFFQLASGDGCGRTFEFNMGQFCHIYHFFPIPVNAALHILERAGYIHYEENPDSAARVYIPIDRDDLYLLDNLDAREDQILSEMLRMYEGLFSKFVYIREEDIAQNCGLTRQQVYMTLKELREKRIIQFVPRKKIPMITYLTDREDEDRIIIPREIYEDRRKIYARRIKAMEDYLQNSHVCRSRQLLDYFGERSTADCGRCDVCIDHRHHPERIAEDNRRHAMDLIMNLLADGKPHELSTLDQLLPLAPEEITDALRALVAEEVIHVNGTTVGT
ncbi:RecQ family ATP-dependent DNA helicase [Prevotella sp. AGR2160]|uniref:RecQ family ATP-dependent DNA helicase n=1 Tax=Prevotella sp. AGR2160 TaxID=1280674 RepID=UPI00040CE9DB|nr:RecQ family ATP-dependent DNA helicase [Prevotella sp. AGR2160]